MSPEQLKMMEDWRSDMQLIFRAHYASSVEARTLNYRLGIPVVILSALVGTSTFATVGSNPSLIAKIIVGCISILVAVLAALQTFMRYYERSEIHREAGAKFAALSKEIDQVLAFPPKDEAALTEWVTSFRKRWDDLSLESPTTSTSTWIRSKQDLTKIGIEGQKKTKNQS